MKELAVTAVNCITAVGHDGRMTSASARAGISRFSEHAEYLDRKDNPIIVARIRGVEENRDTTVRMAGCASLCLKNMFDEYFHDCASRLGQLQILLGVAAQERHGPRYEEKCERLLLQKINEWADTTLLHIIPHGNASAMYAIEQASCLIESDPETLCIIGGVDSLLRESTLNWFKHNNRLKSISSGCHQGLIAGEAVGFMVVEDPARATQSNRPVLARLTGIGLATEPKPRAESNTSRGFGLTNACRNALNGAHGDTIHTVFGDLNGENYRAMEWSMTEVRNFRSVGNHRQLMLPVESCGDIGAASGVVMANIITQGFVRGWLRGPVLMFCSDDHGSRGALVMEK
jgi:3-oxoacyl-[acyl-carrier-protein] synthase-1